MMREPFKLMLICWCIALAASPTCGEQVDFDRDVQPILANFCYECHGPDEASRATDMRLDVVWEVNGADASQAMIVPGDAAGSELSRRLHSDDPEERMPPLESSRKPSHSQIETLQRWIEQGAKHEQHWSFVGPTRRDRPAVSDAEWPRNDVDRIVLAHLEAEGIAPQPDAEATVLARRLALAVNGLPVLPQRLNRFAAAFRLNPELAVDELVDELLASPAYGEHMAWGWLDASRYADTNGYQADGERVMWPWRDWLVRALNANVPFDELTEQMLAGDLLMPVELQSWESGDWIEDAQASEMLLATGFLRNHRYDTGSGTIPAESIFENASDRMDSVYGQYSELW